MLVFIVPSASVMEVIHVQCLKEYRHIQEEREKVLCNLYVLGYRFVHEDTYMPMFVYMVLCMTRFLFFTKARLCCNIILQPGSLPSYAVSRGQQFVCTHRPPQFVQIRLTFAHACVIFPCKGVGCYFLFIQSVLSFSLVGSWSSLAQPDTGIHCLLAGNSPWQQRDSEGRVHSCWL